MSERQIEAMVERWMRDQDFRERMRVAPLETAEAEGFALSEEEKRALEQLDMSGADDELAAQVNFAG